MKQLRGVEVKRFNRQVHKRLKGGGMTHQSAHQKELVLVLFGVDYQSNLGVIFRIADALDVEKIWLTGGSSLPEGKEFAKVSRYKERVVDWEYEKYVDKVMDKLKTDGFEIVGVEITDESKQFNTVKYGDKVALVLGNEGHGLPDKVLKLCDRAVFVPMLGKGGSMNVGVTAAVVGYGVRLG